ncbi:MAG: helix-turn-helix transcriptional regulator [bacterium]
MNVLNRIKELMEDRNWTEYRLAKNSGLSQSTISNLFTRNNTPTISTIESICNAFGITLSQFFTDNTNQKTFVNLNDEEIELLKYWVRLSPEQKLNFLNLIKSIT